ncbi:MAG: redoxin family protein [Acidobacteria bacterium]|nr:redoxin family protein [Acidobacteriota bacterium]
MRLVVLSLLTLVCASAQNLTSPCEPAEEVKEHWRTWVDVDDAAVPYQERRQRQLKRLDDLLAKYPTDVRVNLWKEMLIAGPFRDQRDAAIEEFRKLHEADPNEPSYQFLYAQNLVGVRSEEAISLLEDLLEKEPRFARAHLKLAEIHLFPAFKDSETVIKHLDAFQEAGPDSVDGFAVGRRLNDSTYIERSLPPLRRIVENSEDPLVLRRYEILWSWEFRSRPPNLHDRVRELVRKDIERLESLALTDSIYWYQTLEDGYRVLGDKEASAKIQERFQARFPKSRQSANALQRRWFEENPFPRYGDEDGLDKYGRKNLAATDDWIQRWPEEPGAWSRRLGALNLLKNPPPDMAVSTGDRLLEIYTSQPDSFRSFPPVSYLIAELYLKANIRLDQIPKLVEMGTEELVLDRQRQAQSDYAKPEQQRAGGKGEGNYILRFLVGGPLLVLSHVNRQDYAKARDTLHEMEGWMEESRPNEDDPPELQKAFANKQSLLWELRGRLAEAEGRKPDAAFCYLAAAGINPDPPRPAAYRVNSSERAQRLWKELGGTREGLQAISEHSSTATPQAGSQAKWAESAIPLPDFEITDTDGRLWKLQDLKGKKTFVNLWATWCGFCMPELPVVEKMHKDLAEREDIQVISLNLDENPGVIQPFMEENGYNFPVLPATTFVEKLIPLLSLPRNWIVDPTGMIVHQQLGLDPNVSPEEWLYKKSVELMDAIQSK